MHSAYFHAKKFQVFKDAIFIIVVRISFGGKVPLSLPERIFFHELRFVQLEYNAKKCSTYFRAFCLHGNS